MARPPPARPHIGINPPTRFSSYQTAEWAEDDAWDSASDSESPPQKAPQSKRSTSVGKSSVDQTTSATSARPVPRPTRDRTPSTSSLAFSYTHVSAPSPSSSYSPRPDHLHSPKTSWTIVSRSLESEAVRELEVKGDSNNAASSSVDLDIDDIVIGDMDAEVGDSKSGKFDAGKDIVRDDTEEVVQGRLSEFRNDAAFKPSFRSSMYNTAAVFLCENRA